MGKNIGVKSIGILTSGGDCPGLNAAIRGVAKAAHEMYDIKIIGISNGYRGLIEGDARELESNDFSGILTRGGTILGTSREKPFKTKYEGNKSDSVAALDEPERIKENYKRFGMDALVVLGGNGTNTTASLLAQNGLNVIGLPKTIDNDIAGTDVSFGFHTAVDVATEAIDRLHSTAHSHNRVMVVELMGHKAGWLALYSGIAGGGDVIVLPEIPYSIDSIARHLQKRASCGKCFSIVVVAEGAMSIEEAAMAKKDRRKQREKDGFTSIGYRLAKEISDASAMETRVTVLGYLQRGGIPSAYDRVLATNFGTAAVELLAHERFGRMVAMQNGNVCSVDLDFVANKIKNVPFDHQLIESGRCVGTCFGD